MKKKLFASLAIGAALFMTVPVMAGEAAVGAYEKYESYGITQEAKEAFDKAMVSYEGNEMIYPKRLMETQVVSGTNYRIFCDARTENDETIHYIITVYENLDGACEITDMVEDTVIRPTACTSLESVDFYDYGACVSFAAEDFNWDANTLTFTFYEDVHYYYSEIASLEAGSVIEYYGREVTVATVEEGSLVNTEMGEVPQYYIVKTEDAQEIEFAAAEGGWAVVREDNDQTMMTEIGTIDLPLSEELIVTDLGENMGESIEIPYAELQAYMTEKAADGENYGSASTTMHISDGKIVTINRVWIP